MNPTIQLVTQRIIERSNVTRKAYLEKIERAMSKKVARASLPCSNLAHGFAACCNLDKDDLKNILKSNIGIISSYNDMLSAHRPYEFYPEQIKKELRDVGAVGQMAGGVPAMCDGVTQGEPGMEISLMSRDIISMSVAIALSHNMFDGALYLGICDKIVPGLFIGAMAFGHLPAIFIPAGPMPSGLPNKEKVKIRQLYSEGKATREDLLESESASYHTSGTCTFYGTANSNQMVIELMGLHLPGAAFVHPETTLRFELTNAAARQITRLTEQSGNYMPIGKMVDECVIVNGLVALLATGGSTNLTMHLVAMAKAGGIIINWSDISELSEVVPLLCKIYPNGPADINYFQAAGGTSVLVRELLAGGLLHEDVETVIGRGLRRYTQEPILENGKLIYREGPLKSLDDKVIASFDKPFNSHGGLKVMSGNLGRAVMKTSAIESAHQIIEAPAVVFNNQYDLDADFKAGKLDKNCVVVVRYQGPKAIGMPELHKLITPLGVLQDRGYQVALLTDGRLSGASGKVPAAIHVTPEAYTGGLLNKVQNGDMIRMNGQTGEMTLLVDEKVLAARIPIELDLTASYHGFGRELFSVIRENLTSAEKGAVSF
ncbi:phosphogluconate dehydratase [Orbus sturtevantii]|uniref:phosphogluconate dehydratase n=1 Tax=Orbus sturtevantii TaxID=3074109 RepID=UPI00370D3FE5